MIQKHRKSLLVALTCVFVAATASLLVLSACGKSYSFEKSTVYHSGVEYISPSALSLAEDSVFVSDATANKIYKLNDSGEVVKSYNDFSGAVNSVYVNGNDVYALVGGLAGEIYHFDTSLELKGKAETEHTPNDALAIGDKIYVANRFSNSISVFNKDLSDPEVIKLEDGREPYALATTQDKLYVACKLNGGAVTEEVVAANLVVINPADNTQKTVKLLNGTNSVNGIAVSSDGNYVYLANIFARYTYPTTQLDRGWVNTNGITIFDAVNDEVVAGVLLDGVEQGAANLYGIAVHGEGDDAIIAVAVAGLSQVAVVPEKAVLDRVNEYVENDTKLAKYEADKAAYEKYLADYAAAVEAGEELPEEVEAPEAYASTKDYSAKEIVDHVGFINDVTSRILVEGKGVRDIALSEEGDKLYAYVTQYFDGIVTKIELVKDEYEVRTENNGGSNYQTVTKTDYLAGKVKQYALGTQGAMTQERMGEILWNDASICYQGWESCSSCHPEARSDGLNWDELGDGIGTAKQTKSMMYAHRTPPVLVTGCVDMAETNVAETVMFAFHNDIGEDAYACMDAYLRSLKPVQSPYLNRDGSLTESAINGQKLFNDYNCNACHSGPNYTDMQYHLSASLDQDDSWEDRPLDTPTFVEIWRTRPYLFNGGAVTMEDAVRYFIEKDGKTATDEEIKDIANFILSIGDNGEYYGVQHVSFDTEDGYVSTLLNPGSTMTEVIVRKQWNTETNALVTVTLYDENGKQKGDSVYSVLTGMVQGDYASFKCNMQIPEDLAKGSYYEITITNPDKTSESLATTLRVYYK